MKTRFRRRRRPGFTLMEILLVTAILVALASMAAFAFTALQRNALTRTARTEIGAFESACQMYYSNVNAFPQTLQDLKFIPQGMQQAEWGGPYIDPNKGDVLDPWRTEYRYIPDQANDTVTITSAGPDRSFDTADDISNKS
jgi:general secretion pathway protein G